MAWHLRALAALVVAAPLSLSPAGARAAEALAAVAANFAEVADDLAATFAQASGHQLRTTTGATGKLHAQIVAGAPFHLFLSADAQTPARLEARGAGVAGTRFTYAIGRLALWSADPGRIGADGRAALAAGTFRHLAIANPDLAPYGAAAREVLRALGLWETLRERIVMGQNIGQTHSMVATGNAELGFVALSALVSPRAPARGSRWEVPQDLFPAIRQDAILLRAGADNAAARGFLAYLDTPEARRLIERHGYGVEPRR